MKRLSDQQRYARYAAWCTLLGVKPLSFDRWLRENAKIPEHWPIGWTA